MLSPLAFELPAFLIGLLFGSFLNVCIARLPLQETIARGRSHCPRCLHTIRWYDNIPLLSWIILRARCRDCKATIPWRYPLVELATALWFAFCAFRLWTWLHPTYALDFAGFAASDVVNFWMVHTGIAILGFLLIGLLVMDWQTHTLPDAFTFPGIGIGLFLICVQAIFLGPDEDAIHLNATHSLRMSSPGSFVERGNLFLTGPEHLIFGRIAAVIGAALFPFLIRWIYKLLRGRQGLGLGDVKLMAMIAAFLGFWPAILAFFLGSLFILPYSITLLIRKRADRSTALPFGSFLAAGGLVTALVGPALIDWYKSFL
jgi:leader peptidase (prepilin peptidase)/N-methyltransferase